MSSYFPEPIDRVSLQDGDHVFAYRHGHKYSHHGIYSAKERKVFHFDWSDHWYSKTGDNYNLCRNCGSSPNRLRKSCLDCFLRVKMNPESTEESNAEGSQGTMLYRYEYSQSLLYLITHDAGTCSTQRSDTPLVVVQRAEEMFDYGTFVGRWSSRWRPWNNCESFALYCKTGKYKLGKLFLRLAAGGAFAITTGVTVGGAALVCKRRALRSRTHQEQDLHRNEFPNAYSSS